MVNYPTLFFLGAAALHLVPSAHAFVPTLVGRPSLAEASYSSKKPTSLLRSTTDTVVVEEQVELTVNGASENSLAETTSSSSSTSNSKKPGEIENVKFHCDESVQFWRDFDCFQDNQGNLRLIADLLARNGGSNVNPQRAAYWTSQLLRTSYFVANAALGSIGSDLHERFVGSRRSGSTNGAQQSAGTAFMNLNGGGMTSNLLNSPVPSRLIFEALKSYEQDWKYVESGLLNFPWDSVATANGNNGIRLQLDHKQSNPLFVLSETGRVIRESIGIFGRRNKYGGQTSDQVWMKQPPLPVGALSSTSSLRYPEYYLNDFHYQTDGWFSSESANTYEASTETLFLGRQDAMQRQTLIPLLKHFESAPPQSILEVAAGTGRFATFVRDNFPAADMTITDLSPFYLEKARENDKYWRTYRGEVALKEKINGSGMDASKTPAPATLVQANAESFPFADESFDAVVCVYLFHELPAEARENAAREMARVLKPGGMISFSDSMQTGDRPPLDGRMVAFARLNEPHYEDYVSTSLAPLFERHGLKCSEKYMSSSTKTLSFTKS